MLYLYTSEFFNLVPKGSSHNSSLDNICDFCCNRMDSSALEGCIDFLSVLVSFCILVCKLSINFLNAL